LPPFTVEFVETQPYILHCEPVFAGNEDTGLGHASLRRPTGVGIEGFFGHVFSPVWSDSLVWLCPGLGSIKSRCGGYLFLLEGVNPHFPGRSPYFRASFRTSLSSSNFTIGSGKTQALGEPSDGAFPHPQSADPKKRVEFRPPAQGARQG
jgi:hypothetical protein